MKDGQHHAGALEESVFTLCLSGDLPYQKRFFDAILHGSVPVVIARPFVSGTTPAGTEDSTSLHNVAWWAPSSHSLFGNTSSTPDYSAAASYPDLSQISGRLSTAGGFSYRDFVVQLSEQEAFGDLVGTLERIFADSVQMRTRWEALHAVRQFFLYDFAGEKEDAFSLLLRSLGKRLGVSA